jgi:hypothetical protein
MEPVNEQQGEATPFLPEDGNDLLQVLEKDLDRLKAQKTRQSGGVEGTTLLNLCFLHDEQYVNYSKKGLYREPREENKLYLSFNLIQPRATKLMGRLSAFNAPFKARPNKTDPAALSAAEVVDRMIIATDEKLDEPSKMRERVHWLLVGGTCFEHVPWVPNANIEPNPQYDEQTGELLMKSTVDGQILPKSTVDQLVQAEQALAEHFEPYEEVELVGEVGSVVYGPLNVFIDQTVRSVQDLAPDQWVHIAEIKTIGWIEENYGEQVQPEKDLNILSSRINADGDANGGIYLKDLVPLVQGSADENDPQMVVHVQSYQPASSKHPRGRYVCWIPKQKILHDAENPYEEIPLVDFHWSPVTTNFWTKAYVTPLIAPQRFINKRMSQLGEMSNASIYAPVLLGNGLKAADFPTDAPGVVENGLLDNGQPAAQRMMPAEVAPWFLESIKLAVQMFNDAAGASDLMEDNAFPGQLRGPLAVPMLQEILDTQWGPLFNHLGERLARVKQMRLNRIKQFYPPIRTMHYTDRTQKDEVLTFHTEKVLRAGTNFSITVERGALLPELRALRESRVRERLQGPLAILYMDERTGKLDKSKIAADLQFGDTGREAREAKYRKLAQELIKMLWEGKPVPNVLPFYDHAVMLDELEDAMATTEFLRSSPQIQMMFAERWQLHQQYLQQEALAQQQAMNSQMVHGAVAQATQQAAAQAAAEAVNQTQNQLRAQDQQPTEQYVASAQGQAGGGQSKPRPKSRKVVYEEKE